MQKEVTWTIIDCSIAVAVAADQFWSRGSGVDYERLQDCCCCCCHWPVLVKGNWCGLWEARGLLLLLPLTSSGQEEVVWTMRDCRTAAVAVSTDQYWSRGSGVDYERLKDCYCCCCCAGQFWSRKKCGVWEARGLLFLFPLTSSGQGEVVWTNRGCRTAVAVAAGSILAEGKCSGLWKTTGLLVLLPLTRSHTFLQRQGQLTILLLLKIRNK